MTKNIYQAMKDRRSFYAINHESPISQEQIEFVIEEAVKHTPSAFNSQSARVLLVSNDHHQKLWSIVRESLRKIVPADSFQATSDKIDSFAAGYATVLFFEDTSVVENLQQQFPTYSDNFPIWSNQSNGMLQYAIWLSLENEGFGASLQHYNPLIDAEVKDTWQLPASWKLMAQMPFGLPQAEPGEKTFQPTEERFKVFK